MLRADAGLSIDCIIAQPIMEQSGAGSYGQLVIDRTVRPSGES